MAVTEDTLTTARTELATALRAAAHYGFNEGIDNHFSLAVPGRGDRFLLNPFGPHWSELTADDMLTLDLDGTVVDGDGVAELTAFQIHRGVHQARADARCVLHTHMPFATAISLTETGFDTRISQNSMLFHGAVATLPYNGLATGEEEGARIASAVSGGVRAAFLQNHGVLIIAPTVAEAWRDLYFLERACEVQVLAQSTGQPIVRLSERIAQTVADQWASQSEHAELTFAAVQRQVG